ncbi:hypothetical protein KHP62_03610 [Rhodobacteraceae bacterium NNCM2]|nr:hypothetical protein [Coraliihabitans acroporae]
MPRLFIASLLATALCGALPERVAAQTALENLQNRVVNRDASRRAYGALGVLGLSLVPNETASTLNINTGNSDDSGFAASQIGGAFTVSESFPLYLEGFVGFSRYDPTFVFSEGRQARKIPLKWTSAGGTVGVGWDFKLTDDLVLRPIANGSIGHVESDVSLAQRLILQRTGVDLEFLADGRISAYGYGGSLMLDYARYREAYELDVELRYTHIRLESFATKDPAFKAGSDAKTIGLWSRIRVPTGFHVFDRPLRAVGEFAASGLLGDQQIAIGSQYLAQVGAGLEVDIGAISWLPGQRIRLVGRFVYGENVTGFSTGIGYTF